MQQLQQIQFEQNSIRAESDSERLTEWQDKAMIMAWGPIKKLSNWKAFSKDEADSECDGSDGECKGKFLASKLLN